MFHRTLQFHEVTARVLTRHLYRHDRVVYMYMYIM